MLVRTTLLPSVLNCLTGDTTAYSLVIGLLRALKNNGVILVDEKNLISSAFYQELGEEPKDKNFVKFKKEAQVLLKELEKKNRIVPVPLCGEVSSICRDEPCQYCIRVTKDYSPVAILVRQGCNLCAKNQLVGLPSVKVIDVTEYTLDDTFCSLLDFRDCSRDIGEWNQSQFEQEILIPLFRDAKHIKIYDRWIGRSILQGNADSYKLTLEWFLQVFLRESRKPGIFEVYSGFFTQNRSSLDITSAKIRFHQLETDLQKIYPIFKLIVKNEVRDKQLPHDRYLVTNQVALSIGRGFDLLLEGRSSSYPRSLKEFQIYYCSSPGKIEKLVRTLPDL